MTGKSQKVRGLFLAALMVFSVFAMGAAFTGTAAANHGNTSLTSGETYWVGQQLVYGGGSLTDGNEWQVRDNETGNLISEIEVVNGNVVIDTALTGAGDFILEDPSGTTAAKFEVVEQSLRVGASPERVDNAGPDSVSDLRIRSNRANYRIEVTSDELSQDKLEGIFGSSPNYVSNNTKEGVVLQASNDVTIGADFTGIDPGEYTLNIEGHDSTASTTVDLTIVDPEAADVSFAETVIIQERGDKMLIGLEFQGTANQAHVILGESSSVNYEVNATVTPNESGVATLIWDTSKSWYGSDGGLVGTVEDGADITSVNVRDDVNRVVETGEYPVSVEYQGDETDIATAVVEERSTNGVSTHTAPAAKSGEDVFKTMSSAENGDTIAVDPTAGNNGVHDWVVLRLDASGLDGYVNGPSDLWSPGPDNGVNLTVIENDETVGTNEDPGVWIPMSSDLFWAGNDEYYVAFKASELLSQDDVEVGAKFDVIFQVDSQNPATSETTTKLASFELVEGQSAFDLEGQRIFVPASDGAEVTGTSTWAPGTRMSATLRSTGGQAPFTQQNKSMIVQSDGTFSGTFNLGDQPEGQTFTATLRHTDAGQQQEVEGQIGELSASVSFGDQVAEDAGTLVEVDEVTLSEGGFVAIRKGSADGKIIGYSSYLEAGTHNDVQIRLDEPVSDRVTLVAVAHKDTDNNKQFGYVALDGAEDGAYTSGGSGISDSATVSIPTPTPTETKEPETDTPTETMEPTDTPTETMEPTDTPTPTDAEDEETPGFGLVVALVALLAAALLAVRRDN